MRHHSSQLNRNSGKGRQRSVSQRFQERKGARPLEGLKPGTDKALGHFHSLLFLRFADHRLQSSFWLQNSFLHPVTVPAIYIWEFHLHVMTNSQSLCSTSNVWGGNLIDPGCIGYCSLSSWQRSGRRGQQQCANAAAGEQSTPRVKVSEGILREGRGVHPPTGHQACQTIQ